MNKSNFYIDVALAILLIFQKVLYISPRIYLAEVESNVGEGNLLARIIFKCCPTTFSETVKGKDYMGETDVNCKVSTDGTPCNKPCKGKICKAEGGAKCEQGRCLRGPHPNICHNSNGQPNGTPCDKKCNGIGCKKSGGSKCKNGKCIRGIYTNGQGKLVDEYETTKIFRMS
jgi:hypothetical protein